MKVGRAHQNPAVESFPQVLQHEADCVLQRCTQCYTQLLMLHVMSGVADRWLPAAVAM